MHTGLLVLAKGCSTVGNSVGGICPSVGRDAEVALGENYAQVIRGGASGACAVLSAYVERRRPLALTSSSSGIPNGTKENFVAAAHA